MLKLRNIFKEYTTTGETKVILNNVSYDFPPSGFVTILGESGSGKSTLLNLLSLNEKPTSGEILYDGEDISHFKEHEIEAFRREEIGFLYQKFNLFPELTAFENIVIPLKIKGMKKKEMENLASSFIDKFNLVEVQDTLAKDLSGGELERVAFIRSIIGSPSILLADEPTGSLDDENGEILLKELKEYSRRRLVIMVTHDRENAEKYSDIVLRLEKGRLIEEYKRDGPFLFYPNEKEKSHPNQKWVSLFTKDLIRKNKKEYLFLFLASSLVFLTLFLSLGFFNGKDILLNDAMLNSVGIYHSYVTKQKAVTLEGSPLSLVQDKRPSVEEVYQTIGTDDYLVETDLSYAFPMDNIVDVNGFKLGPVSFVPLQSFPEDLVFTSGENITTPTFDYVLVNQAFVDLLPPLSDPLKVDLKYEAISIYRRGSDGEEFNLTHSFKISGVIDEYQLIKKPTIYYSYPALKFYLSRCILNAFSSLDEKVTVLDFIQESKEDNECSSYRRIIFSKDKVSAEKLLKISNEELKFTSPFRDSYESFQSLSDSISNALIPFLIGEVFISCFIIASFAQTIFLKRKKESAILRSLGASKSNLFWLYSSGNFIVGFASLLICFALAYPFALLVNALLGSIIGINNFIVIPFTTFLGVPFLLYPLSLLFMLVLIGLSLGIPLFLFLRTPLVEELRDE